MKRPLDPDPRLPYPTKPLFLNGLEFEEYIIPAEDKAAVLSLLYPFRPVPSLSARRLDLHSGKAFRVRDFRVTREGCMNCLVSPFYEEGGGTVIDWVPTALAAD